MKREPKVEFYQDTNGKWRWRFRAANGRILADSAEGYSRLTDCVHGSEIVLASPTYSEVYR